MDFSTIYRLKDLKKNARKIYSEDGNPYEKSEDYALVYKGQLCIEHYYSERGFDYNTTIKFEASSVCVKELSLFEYAMNCETIKGTGLLSVYRNLD